MPCLCILTTSFPRHAGENINAGVFVRDFARACAALLPDTCVHTHRKGRPGDYRDTYEVVEYRWLGTATSLTSLNSRSLPDVIAALSLLVMGTVSYLWLCRRRSVGHSFALWAVPSGFYAWTAWRLMGVPYSVWALGSDIWRYEHRPFMGRVIRRVLRDARFLFADAPELAARVTALCGRPCGFLPSTRDLSNVRPHAVTEERARPRFLFVGRYEYVKGPDVLIEAARLYFAGGGRGSLVLFGTGKLESSLREAVGRHGLRDRVDIQGAIEPEDLVGRLAWCDYLVIPSRQESIPVVLSDAMQIGAPVIVSDVGDMGQVVRETGLGMVVPPQQPAALADALAEGERRLSARCERKPGLRPPLDTPLNTARRFLAMTGLRADSGGVS